MILFCTGCNKENGIQLSTIGKGWSQNSINAVIFRKNSLIYANGKQYAAYYDSTGTVVLARRNIGEQRWKLHRTRYKGNIFDAHCSISIMADGEGYLHMAWDQHDNTLNYCKSLKPGSMELGDKIPMTGTHEDKVSYPEFYKLPNGNLLFFYRNGRSGKGNLVINNYDTGEKNWKRLQSNLLDGENTRNAYWQACIDSKGIIHISWVWRETWDVATNHDISYAKSTDGGLTWKKSNGEKYNLPITATTAEIACAIPMGSELINQTSMNADNKSRPYIVSYWRSDTGSIPQYQLVYKKGNTWRRKQISCRKTDFTLSGGGTKKIPISRPQLVIDTRNYVIKPVMVYRDSERDNKVSITYCNDIHDSTWFTNDLTDFPVNSWEPTYDTELWKEEFKLSLFIQRVGQGDSESLENVNPQPIIVLDIQSLPVPADTFLTREF